MTFSNSCHTHDGRVEFLRIRDLALGDPLFKRSSLCGNGSCVEVLISDTEVRVRDSKQVNSPELAFTHDEWSTFLAGVRLGEFELADRVAVV